jgi:spindle assembly abnormal protein 6
MQADLSSTQAQLSACEQQLKELKDQYNRHLLEVEADFKTQRATSQEESMRERAKAKQQHEK